MIGQTLGHYKILDKLGAGGMGEVYRAEDTTLKRLVALKVLPQELAASPDRLQRFQREAETLAAIDHPNIVHIYTVESAELANAFSEDSAHAEAEPTLTGEDAALTELDLDQVGAGLPRTTTVNFLTMQLVRGKQLADLIPDDGMPVERILELAIPLVDALRAAHERGIIHRDLKPENVMVDDEGRVKILDFGLAKLRLPDVEDGDSMLSTQAMTQAGVVMGTVPYMSPEQLQGRPMDHRTDIFSLGILLYEMACGVRPFRGEDPVSLMSSILRDAPDSVAELRTGCPQRLVETIEKCLEKDREDRFPTARELHSQLLGLQGEVTAGQAEVARPRPKGGKLGLGTRILLAAALILAVVAGAVWFSNRGPEEPTEVATQGPQIRSLAVLPMRNLSGDEEQEYLVDGMTEALITDLSRISELQVASRSSAMRYKGTDKPLSEVARELNVDGIVEGSVAREGDRIAVTAQLIEAATETNLWADRYEREIASILTLQGEVARAIAREIQVTLTPQEEALLTSSREVDPEAYEAYLKGMAQFYELTPAGMKAAQHYFEQALEKDPDYAQAHGGMALFWAGLQQMGGAPVAVATPKAKESAARALETDDSVAEAHYALAIIRTWSDWDWEGAETAFRRAIELKPNWADVRAYYAHYLMITRRTEEAIAQMEQAVEIDPYNTLVQALNGVLLENTDRCEEALAFYRSTLEATPNHPLALGGLVRAYYCLGMYDETYEAAVANWAARGRPEAVAALEDGYGADGFTGAMSSLAEWKIQQDRLGKNAGASFNFAAAGKNQEALDHLELAFEEHDPSMPYIGVTVTLRNLRNEPRFQDLLRRMNLPESPP
jgi:serine/threonine protein kinase/Tfp pilus assembly protein PilF